MHLGDTMTRVERVETTRSSGRARRVLAVFALLATVIGLIGTLLAPTRPPVPAPPPQRDAAGIITPPGPLPRLCSACGAAAPPWVDPAHSPVVVGPGGPLRVDPRRIAAAASEAPPDRRFGVVEAFTSPFAASYAGVGWERVNFDWPSLQPTGPHMWNRAAVPGTLLAREIAAGREIVGIIGGRPHWAMDAHGLPLGLYLPPNDPRNLWGAFVAELARRYRGRVKDWIVWNEPDVWDPHNGGYTWPGTVEDFARLLKVAYVQIKSVDPSLVVHLAATTYWWDRAYNRPLYLDRLFDVLARDPNARKNNWYFDVASAHIYNVPDDVETIINIDRDLMRKHGFDKPIWLVETNAMPTRDGPWAMVAPRWMATAGEQASYVVQASALALAADAARVEFYKMADPAHLSPQAYPVGLVRPDGTARPVIAALRATTHALAGWVRASDLGTTASGVRVVAVTRRGGAATLVLWNTRATPVTVTVGLTAPAGATQEWLDGHIDVVTDEDTRLPLPATLSGTQATLRLTLPASTCAQDGLCRIGGAPMMVLAPSMPRLVGSG